MSSFLDFLRQNWSILVAVVSLIWASARLFFDSRYANSGDIRSINERVGRNEQALQILTESLSRFPSSQEISRLEILISNLSGEVKVLHNETNALRYQVKLLIEKEIK